MSRFGKATRSGLVQTVWSPTVGQRGRREVTGFPITSTLGPLYFMQLVVPEYTGALFRVVRSSDSATRLVYAGANGKPYLDSAFTTWVGATTLTIDEIYDQRGIYAQMTQTTAGSRPTFDPAKVLNGDYGLSGVVITTRGMNLPSSIVVQRNDLGAVIVQSPLSFGANTCPLQFDTVLTNRLAIQGSYGDNKLGSHHIDATSTFSTDVSTLKNRSQPQVQAFVARAGGGAHHVDEQTLAIPSVTDRTLTGGNVGLSSNSGSIEGEYYGVAIYMNAPSDTQLQAAKNYCYTAFNIMLASNWIYVMDGDSITHGRGSTLSKNLQYYFEKNIGRKLFVENVGLNGQTANFLYTNRVAREASMRRATNRDYRVFIGTNDLETRATGTIVGYGSTIWTSYTLPLVQYMIAQGWRVFVCTMLPRVWTGSAQDITDKTAERTSYNNLITSNAGTYGYTVIDYGSISVMQTPSSTTYYVDGVHPNDAGYQAMSTLEVSVVQPLAPAA